MTYADIYKEEADQYTARWTEHLKKFQTEPWAGMNVVQLQTELERRQGLLKELETEKPTEFMFDVRGAVTSKYSSLQTGYDTVVANVRAKYQDIRDQIMWEREQEIKRLQADAEASTAGIESKYAEVLSYRDKIADAVLRYGIKPSELQLDVEKLSLQEVDQLLDAALAACKFVGGDSVRSKLRKIYEVDDSTIDEKTQLMWYGSLLLICLALSPFLLVGMFGYMCFRTKRIYKHAQGLRIADRIMCGLNFAQYRTEVDLSSIPEVDFTETDAAEQAELEKLSVGDPAKELEKVQDEINSQYQAISDDFRRISNNVMHLYDTYLRELKVSIQDMSKWLEDYKSKQVEFGSVCNLSYTMDTNFVLGRAKDVLDVKYDMGLRNIVFQNRNPDMLQFAKLLLGNALLSVRPKQFKCTIYDPEGLGADFATFLCPETADYIRVVTDDFNKYLTEHRNYALANLRILDQTDINTFNKDAEAKGMVTLEYRLLFIVSGVEKPSENKLLTEFMQFSARTGAMVWLVSPTPLKDCIMYNKPFSGVESPYPVSATTFNRVRNTYTDALANLKGGGILWRTAFQEKYLPEDKWWTENTDKGIKLNVGLQDGDPSKGYDIVMGDKLVHGLCVGGTGAGKSVFNNQLICSLITRYSPADLELILVDFKNIEFISLTDPETRVSRIPHARIIAGTKDGEYALSIFDYLIAEMDRRTRIFQESGSKKLEEHNQKMRLAGTPEKCLPRILLIIDEFQVMFTEVETKIVDMIQSRIRSLSKLARFCGCHMLFTSQSMAGTMAKDVKDQFSLRVALRCAADVSEAVIGKNLAAKMPEPRGYLYTNESGGENQDTTRFWRTPWLDVDDVDLYKTLDKVEQMCAERGALHHHAKFYDEAKKHSIDEQQVWFAEHQDSVQKAERLLLLGERTNFSLKTAPNNVILRKGDGENIVMHAFETADFNNLCLSLIENVRQTPNATLLLNCADQDTYDVLDIPSWYNPDFLDTAIPMSDCTPWLEYLEGLIAQRKASAEKYGPLYFFAIRWDKQNGLGRNDVYTLTERWDKIVTDAPSVDIHIVLCVQEHRNPVLRSFAAYNHIICARTGEEASYKYLDDKAATRLPDSLGFAIYRYGTNKQKFKIYQSQFTKQIEGREIDDMSA